jgi:hypothetical protein
MDIKRKTDFPGVSKGNMQHIWLVLGWINVTELKK